MQDKSKPSPKPQINMQGYAVGLLISNLRYLIVIVGLFGLAMFWLNNRPLPDRIETNFSMTLPDNTRNFGWYDWAWDGYLTLVSFTVDIEDLERTLQSVEWENNRCISAPREPGYLPDFYSDESLDWWQPFAAIKYDGVSCYDYNPNGLAPNFHIMVDYTVSDEATVYIEHYSVDATGNRALWD